MNTKVLFSSCDKRDLESISQKSTRQVQNLFIPKKSPSLAITTLQFRETDNLFGGWA